MGKRQCLDAELVRRGLVESRQRARALIEAHAVKVNGSFADKPARLVDRGDSVELVEERPPYVSRGGQKLARALDTFMLNPRGRRCLDAGASTGGFTDCLLQRGAAHVVAVDVGYGQLHESLTGHGQVTNLERTNIKSVDVQDIGGPVDLLVGDLSFISLGAVFPALVSLCAPGADLVLLVKPQFEAARQEASKGKGIIRDPDIWRRVLHEVADAAESAGAGLAAATVSPIRGGHGNVEFLFHLTAHAARKPVDLDKVVEAIEPSASDLR